MVKVNVIATLMILQGFLFFHAETTTSLTITPSPTSTVSIYTGGATATTPTGGGTTTTAADGGTTTTAADGGTTTTAAGGGTTTTAADGGVTTTTADGGATTTTADGGTTTTTADGGAITTTAGGGATTTTAAGGATTTTADGGATTTAADGGTATTAAGGGATTTAAGGGATTTAADGGATTTAAGGGATTTAADGGATTTAAGGGATTTAADGGATTTAAGGGISATTTVGGGGASVTTAAGGGASATTAAGGSGASVTTTGGGGGVVSPTATQPAPASSSVVVNKKPGPQVTLSLKVEINCTGGHLMTLNSSLQTDIKEAYDKAGFKIKSVTTTSISCNSLLNIALDLWFYSENPKVKTIKAVFDDAVKGGSIDNLTPNKTEATFTFVGVTIKFEPKEGQCQQVCCDGGGGEMTVEAISCTPDEKCEGIVLPEDKKEDGHCPGDSIGDCSVECKDDSGGIHNSPSFAVVFLLAVASFIKTASY